MAGGARSADGERPSVQRDRERQRQREQAGDKPVNNYWETRTLNRSCRASRSISKIGASAGSREGREGREDREDREGREGSKGSKHPQGLPGLRLPAGLSRAQQGPAGLENWLQGVCLRFLSCVSSKRSGNPHCLAFTFNPRGDLCSLGARTACLPAGLPACTWNLHHLRLLGCSADIHSMRLLGRPSSSLLAWAACLPACVACDVASALPACLVPEPSSSARLHPVRLPRVPARPPARLTVSRQAPTGPRRGPPSRTARLPPESLPLLPI